MKLKTFRFHDFRSRQILAVCLVLFSYIFIINCGGKYVPPVDTTAKSLGCAPAEKLNSFEEVIYDPKNTIGVMTFSDLKDSVNSACMNCHMAPSRNGNFTYIDSFKGEIKTIAGETKFYPGLYEIAEKVVASINTDDPIKKMPPPERRQKNPDSFIEIGRRVSRWIEAGKPNGSFTADSSQKLTTKPTPTLRSSELGECIPKAEILGFDYGKDRFFASTVTLPLNLADTDLFSLDSFELAKKGTLAYNVEYPLWADNAGKGRWVHFPMKKDGSSLKVQAAEFVTDSQNFEIPDNTRFYKTFYRKIKQLNGKFRFKRIETRIIVKRTPGDKSLFGTYKWDDLEQTATLVQTPYRDGSSFKDTIFPVVVEENIQKSREKIRDYAIPGKHRCVECHSGALGRNFILGFSPLQLNHRNMGEAGRENPITEAEKSQIQRFIDYGVIKKAPPIQNWPKLENLGNLPPKNVYEMRAQGYMVGNCAHCHNTNGFAFSSENNITLSLAPGAIFGFNSKLRSAQLSSRFLVHPSGDIEQSHIWRKVADSSAQLGITGQMPLSTPGGPDCKVLKVMGQWIRSFESEQAAESFQPNCKKENEFKWIDQDFTEISSEFYVPRREDWYNPEAGMSKKYRDLELTPLLANAITKKYAVGYWNAKPECSFPKVDLPLVDRRPWMMKGSQPKKPFGEIYYTTPGSWYFRTSCMKCHGPQADGNTALARGILNWSGGKVRVANLISGLFGNKNENLKTFDKDGKNFSAQYMIWMAMEGTRVQFPPELSSFVGKHGGQMLNQMREKCMNQISPEKPSSKNFMDHEVFREVCFVDNLQPGDPNLAFDPNTNKPVNLVAIDQWADRAAVNVGFAIFDFLKSAGKGDWQVGNDQCEKVFSAGGVQ